MCFGKEKLRQAGCPEPTPRCHPPHTKPPPQSARAGAAAAAHTATYPSFQVQSHERMVTTRAKNGGVDGVHAEVSVYRYMRHLRGLVAQLLPAANHPSVVASKILRSIV